MPFSSRRFLKACQFRKTQCRVKVRDSLILQRQHNFHESRTKTLSLSSSFHPLIFQSQTLFHLPISISISISIVEIDLKF
ncbi:hypothetical protein QVD17_39120 [Tagetes erecta]|uniref:Uncharacterized protein n=1 Tax=Tagetes erecta TaxID=13708 RepID=A0AAD8JQ56_TARER|nr:hypothetical protein QVD17_39120 [Tagetes erecta]